MYRHFIPLPIVSFWIPFFPAPRALYLDTVITYFIFPLCHQVGLFFHSWHHSLVAAKMSHLSISLAVEVLDRYTLLFRRPFLPIDFICIIHPRPARRL